jgi:hypothetical protein
MPPDAGGKRGYGFSAARGAAGFAPTHMPAHLPPIPAPRRQPPEPPGGGGVVRSVRGSEEPIPAAPRPRTQGQQPQPSPEQQYAPRGVLTR